MTSFHIGSDQGEKILLTVLGYERGSSGQFHDDNWLLCELSVRAGAFSGTFQANFLSSELEGLRRGLERLYRELRGGYRFDSMEGQLAMDFSCDSLGHVRVAGTAEDRAGVGHRLSFRFLLDQSYFTVTLRELAAVTAAFPVRA